MSMELFGFPVIEDESLESGCIIFGGPLLALEETGHPGEMSPCPFCGAKGSAIVDSDDRITYYVWCMTCEASGPREGSRLEAAESWNRPAKAPVPLDNFRASVGDILHEGKTFERPTFFVDSCQISCHWIARQLGG